MWKRLHPLGIVRQGYSPFGAALALTLLLDLLPVVVSAAVTPGMPTGSWLAENILGGGVLDRLQTILMIDEKGSMSGFGGCNTLRGKATFAGDALSFGPIMSTRKACSPAIMDQETKFLSALERVRRFTVDAVRRKLILFDEEGTPILIFAAK